MNKIFCTICFTKEFDEDGAVRHDSWCTQAEASKEKMAQVFWDGLWEEEGGREDLDRH